MIPSPHSLLHPEGTRPASGTRHPAGRQPIIFSGPLHLGPSRGDPPIISSGSLPLTGRAGEGVFMYRDQQQRDFARFRVIRFRNQSLVENIWAVVEEIKWALVDRRECSPLPQPSPPRGRESETVVEWLPPREGSKIKGIIGLPRWWSIPTPPCQPSTRRPADDLAGSHNEKSALDSFGTHIHCWASQQWHPATSSLTPCFKHSDVISARIGTDELGWWRDVASIGLGFPALACYSSSALRESRKAPPN